MKLASVERVSGMFEALWQGAIVLGQPSILATIFIAVVIGLVLGIIPGLSGLVGCALFLPIVYLAPADIAISLLVALHAVAFTGGSVTAILLNIPGQGPSAATLLDGFPMNQRGEGARAIGASVTSSAAGGVVAVFFALGMIPLVMPIVMAFKWAEMCVLIVVGLSFMAALSGGSTTKGLISGLLGVLIGLVGFQGVTGIYRFTFGSMFLYEGLGIVGVALGLFALPELFDIIIKGQTTIAQRAIAAKLSDVLQGARDVWRHKWLWLRSTLLGYIVGIIPGIGGEVATWTAYGQAKQTSRNREKFGTGCVEGVIAPESANNASCAGSLLTTMAFGIPGSAVAAILLGAFLVVGVIPGPKMLSDHLPLVFTLLLGIALANMIGGAICFVAASHLAKVSRVHIDYLFPTVLVLVLVGAFVAANSMLNTIVVIAFGLIGLLMKRFGYSRPALLLGFILGELFEYYFFLAYKSAGALFFVTPMCIAFLAILVGLFSYPYLRKVSTYRFQRGLKKS